MILSSHVVAATVMMTHQLVSLFLQVRGKGQEIHKSDSFIYLKQQQDIYKCWGTIQIQFEVSSQFLRSFMMDSVLIECCILSFQCIVRFFQIKYSIITKRWSKKLYFCNRPNNSKENSNRWIERSFSLALALSMWRPDFFSSTCGTRMWYTTTVYTPQPGRSHSQYIRFQSWQSWWGYLCQPAPAVWCPVGQPAHFPTLWPDPCCTIVKQRLKCYNFPPQMHHFVKYLSAFHTRETYHSSIEEWVDVECSFQLQSMVQTVVFITLPITQRTESNTYSTVNIHPSII